MSPSWIILNFGPIGELGVERIGELSGEGKIPSSMLDAGDNPKHIWLRPKPRPWMVSWAFLRAIAIAAGELARLIGELSDGLEPRQSLDASENGVVGELGFVAERLRSRKFPIIPGRAMPQIGAVEASSPLELDSSAASYVIRMSVVGSAGAEPIDDKPDDEFDRDGDDDESDELDDAREDDDGERDAIFMFFLVA